LCVWFCMHICRVKSLYVMWLALCCWLWLCVLTVLALSVEAFYGWLLPQTSHLWAVVIRNILTWPKSSMVIICMDVNYSVTDVLVEKQKYNFSNYNCQFLLCLCHLTLSAKGIIFSGCSPDLVAPFVRSSVRSSCQILLPWYLVSGLNSFDKTDGIFTSPYWWPD